MDMEVSDKMTGIIFFFVIAAISVDILLNSNPKQNDKS
jgi:hypothetical protein